MGTVTGQSTCAPTAGAEVAGVEPAGPAAPDEAMGPMVGRLRGLASELDGLAGELEALGTGRPGAIAVDRHLPTPNGFEATAAIRALRSAGRLTPIVATPTGATSHGPGGHLDRGVDSGAPSDEVTIDPDVLHQLGLLGEACGTEFLSGLTAHFLDGTRPLMVRLRAGVEEGDTVEVARAAHLVEALAGDLGGRRLAAACRRLGVNALFDSLSEDQSDLRQVEMAYDEMTASLVRLLPSAKPLRPLPS